MTVPPAKIEPVVDAVQDHPAGASDPGPHAFGSATSALVNLRLGSSFGPSDLIRCASPGMTNGSASHLPLAAGLPRWDLLWQKLSSCLPTAFHQRHTAMVSLPERLVQFAPSFCSPRKVPLDFKETDVSATSLLACREDALQGPHDANFWITKSRNPLPPVHMVKQSRASSAIWFRPEAVSHTITSMISLALRLCGTLFHGIQTRIWRIYMHLYHPNMIIHQLHDLPEN